MKKPKSYAKRFFILIMTGALIYGLICGYVATIRTVHSMAQSRMEQVANEAIQNAISDAAAKCHTYGELVTVCRNEEGAIESLALNPHAVNMLKSDIALRILEYLNDEDRYTIEVPLGNFLSSGFLAGFGPGIKLRVIPFNVSNIDFESEFTTAGINQVLHKVIVRAEVKIGALLPGYEGMCDVSSSAVITESIIMGDVPQTFFSLER